MLQVIFEKVLAPLIKMLQTGDETGRELAALGLHHLAVSEAACQKISAGGAIQPLVQLLSSGATGEMGAAADALASLALDPRTRELIVTGGALPPLLGCFDAQHGFGAWLWGPARAWARLAEQDAETRRRVYAGGALGPLVRLLGGSGEQEGAADLGQAEGIAAFLKAANGLFARLVAHLEEEPYSQQVLSALVWEGLALLPEVRELLLGPEALDPVVRCLGGGTPALTEALARGLGSLAEAGGDAVAELCNRRVIPPLVRLLEREPLSGKEAAARALSQLLSHSKDSIWEEMVDEGVLAPLISLLQQGPAEATEAKEAAAMLCEKLALGGDEARDRMADAGVLRALFDAVTDEDNSAAVEELAAQALMGLTQSPSAAEMLVTEGGVDPLIELLLTGPDLIAALAAGNLGNLASGDDGVKSALVERGCVPVLVRVLEYGSATAKRCAALALESLAKSKSAADAIAEKVGNLFSPNNTPVFRSGQITRFLRGSILWLGGMISSNLMTTNKHCQTTRLASI